MVSTVAAPTAGQCILCYNWLLAWVDLGGVEERAGSDPFLPPFQPLTIWAVTSEWSGNAPLG